MFSTNIKNVLNATGAKLSNIKNIFDTNMIASVLYLQNKDSDTVINIDAIGTLNNKYIANSLHKEMKQSKETLLQKWYDNGCKAVTDTQDNKLHEWGDTQKFNLTSNAKLFFVGDGQLFSYLTSDGKEAEVHFYIRDKFEDPFDIGIDFSTPYKLHWDYKENFSRKDAESYIHKFIDTGCSELTLIGSVTTDINTTAISSITIA